jgi:energy-coupling factor transporter ATP-binding protein EcfA2
MLEAKGLTVKYGSRTKPAVADVSFRLEPNEFVLLAGDSASGKSTLMQTVCGFIPHIVPAKVSGTVEMDGKKVDDPISIARVVGMVQQDPETQFCTDVVEDEVAFGLENFGYEPGIMRKRIEESLRSVDALHLKDRKLSTLSGGEKQKVAIASMLALEPKILILDEPTSSLDPRSVKDVISAVKALRDRGQMTTVVVEHRLSGFLDIAIRIMVMENGRLVSDDQRGSPRFERISETARLTLELPRPTRRNGVVLSARGLCYQVGAKKILDGVSFAIEEGSVVAVMGENGAGKTTLLRLIMGLIRPSAGAIQVFDHANGNGKWTEPWTLAKDIGLVFQNPDHQIFESSIEKEIQFASANFGASLDAANRAVRSFEDAELVAKEGHPHCLSIGQRRRVNILSSSSHEPRLLLLDEPLIGQDRTNTVKIAELLEGLQRRGMTIVVVTHDPDFARAFCTDALLLGAGKLVAAGQSSEVIRREDVDLFRRCD